MTVVEHQGQRDAPQPAPPPHWRPRTDPAPLLPDAEPYRLLGVA
ncbi:pyruvate dehydrogenase (acetyl-transferring) E1 component subunit alpha, partial [Streptomyces sp. SID11233]|nr:pyruvate dehydrogenase (acetyl-transferring) E1 component subunit alpha [Streptomyces sp. SID11233]